MLRVDIWWFPGYTSSQGSKGRKAHAAVGEELAENSSEMPRGMNFDSSIFHQGPVTGGAVISADMACTYLDISLIALSLVRH